MFAGANATDRAILEYARRTTGASLNMIFVRTAAEAIAYLRGKGSFADRHRYPLPEILVLDRAKPRMSPWEVMDWLKTRPDLNHIQVCFITAEDDRAAVSKAKSYGRCFFREPLDAESYMDLVETLCADTNNHPENIPKRTRNRV